MDAIEDGFMANWMVAAAARRFFGCVFLSRILAVSFRSMNMNARTKEGDAPVAFT